MKRGMMGLAVAMFAAVLFVSPAFAEESLGQFCWRMDPFVDMLHLSVTQLNGPAAIFEIHGRIRANAASGQNAAGGNGPAAYQLVVAGTVADSVTPANSFDAGVSGQHNSAFFGGNLGCNFHGVISSFFLGGTWELECPGPVPYTKSGTLTFVGGCTTS